MPEPIGEQTPAKSSGTPNPQIKPSAPPHIHDHELICRIGQGSYGEVWLARNAVGTLRAVKIVRRQTFERVEHFEREFKGLQKFEPISRSHPGLVDILQIGRDEAADHFYYIMELADAAEPRVNSNQCSVIDGSVANALTGLLITDSLITDYSPKTLRSEIQRRGRLPVEECLRVALALVSALEHLHGQGLVHRDIKPSNIIFVDGTPKLADIGLVAHIDDARSLVGTAGYIPPEGPGTRQADLYSLGKVLYEISLGKDRQDFPQLPPDLQSHPDHGALLELNEVILRACETDPRRRYASAEQLHTDLLLLRRGQSVKHKRAAERRWGITIKIGLATAVIAATLLCYSLVRTERASLTPAQKLHAQKLYLQARAYADQQTQEGCAEAVSLFRQAIAIDPAYAMAYVGLADNYAMMSGWHLPPNQVMPEAKDNAMRALAIDPNLVDAHAWLGYVKLRYDWDWPGAEKEIRQAIALNPKAMIGHGIYVQYLWAMGRLSESQAELSLAQQLGPASPRMAWDVATQLYFERRYDEMIVQCAKTIATETNITDAMHSLLAYGYKQKGMYLEALAEVQLARSIKDSPAALALEGNVLATMGNREAALRELEELEKLRLRYVSAYCKGLIHVGLGNHQEAMAALEQACQERNGGLIFLKVNPVWDNLRGEPRFIELVKKVGLSPVLRSR